MKRILFDEDYWDCDCEINYIHHKSQLKCLKCGVDSGEQPDSKKRSK